MAVAHSTTPSEIHLQPEYLAYYWRGSCLDRFSRGEVAISDCLEAIRETGGTLDPESRHPGAVARSRSLAVALATQKYGGHQKMAIKRLEEWAELSAHRAALAHGLFELNGDGVKICLTDYLGGERCDHPPKSYSLQEMRTFLAELEECVQKLVVQLGQIRAFCRKGTN